MDHNRCPSVGLLITTAAPRLDVKSWCLVNDQIGCLINQSDVVRDVALVCFELNNLSHERITVRNATSQFLNSGRIPYLAILFSGKGHYTNPDT